MPDDTARSTAKLFLLKSDIRPLMNHQTKDYIDQLVESEVIDGLPEDVQDAALLLATAAFRQGWLLGHGSHTSSLWTGEN